MFENISIIAAPLLVISAMPQTVKLYQRKTSDDISMWTYILTWIGIFFILLEADGTIFIANFCSLFMLSINLFLIITYRYSART